MQTELSVADIASRDQLKVQWNNFREGVSCRFLFAYLELRASNIHAKLEHCKPEELEGYQSALRELKVIAALLQRDLDSEIELVRKHIQ